MTSHGSFHPLYRGTWFPTYIHSDQYIPALPVSIRYIAVLGSQQATKASAIMDLATGFHPLYRGTWFPTLPEKHPL